MNRKKGKLQVNRMLQKGRRDGIISDRNEDEKKKIRIPSTSRAGGRNKGKSNVTLNDTLSVTLNGMLTPLTRNDKRLTPTDPMTE